MVSRNRTTPFLYEEIADHISSAIDEGTISYGEKLPSLREMSVRFSCSISVVTQAYEELEHMGKAVAVERSGFYVAHPHRSQAPEAHAERFSLEREEVHPLSMIGKIVEASNNKAIVPLGAGIPDTTLLPVHGLKQSVGRIAKNHSELFQEYTNEAGSRRLRVEIARQMAAKGVHVPIDEILVTNGCTEALSLAIQVTTHPGDTVVIESPVFLGTIQLLKELNRKVVPVPTSSLDGMDLVSLEQVLRRERIAAIIMTAVFQNPLGFVMPQEKRAKAVELAGTYGVPIIEDDVYGDTSFTHETMKPLKSFDTAGNVLYCASYSKSLGPGMRIGWLIGGSRHRQCRTLKTALSLGGSPILQEGLADFFSANHYHRHIKRLQTSMAKHAWEMRQLILESFDPPVALTEPSGGYYIWIELPEGTDSLLLFERALAEGIGIVPGPAFSSAERYRNYIRMSYGSPITDATRRGIARLGELCRTAT